MPTTFICYQKCSTCKKAREWLVSHKIDFDERDIVLNNPSKQELKKWIKESGLDIKRWFNTSGLKYKELALKDKLPKMSDEEKIELLSTDGMLVKRPIIIADKGITIGFKEEELKKLF